MKKILLSLLILVASFFLFQKLSQKKEKLIQNELLLNQEKTNISSSVLKLFELTKLPKPSSLKEAIRLTQKKWIRPRGLERWESKNYLNLTKKEEQKAFQIFEHELFMTKKIEPSQKEYDVAIVLGALAQTMRSRFSYLVKLLEEKKIKVKKIVFLVGARPIFPDRETPEILLGSYKHTLPLKETWSHEGPFPSTEAEAAKLIVSQTKLPDESFRENIVFVDTPMQLRKNGKLRRPNTQDTVLAWLKTKPEAQTILSLSSNPYCGYQHAVTTRLLPKTWNIETIGKAPGRNESIEIYFDSVARSLYQYR